MLRVHFLWRGFAWFVARVSLLGVVCGDSLEPFQPQLRIRPTMRHSLLEFFFPVVRRPPPLPRRLSCAPFFLAWLFRVLSVIVVPVRFKRGDVTVLVATDLAARGLDITVSFCRDAILWECRLMSFTNSVNPPNNITGEVQVSDQPTTTPPTIVTCPGLSLVCCNWHRVCTP